METTHRKVWIKKGDMEANYCDIGSHYFKQSYKSQGEYQGKPKYIPQITRLGM